MRFDSVAAWLAWQERLHPAEIDLGLSRVAHVFRAMGLSRPAPVVITIGGTNGKGSAVAMLSAIYQAAGYRVGSYTSPHLLCYNERIQINQQSVDDVTLCRAFQRVDDARGNVSLTYFEFGTLAALLCMAEQDLDVALLEVGLGGRLDAVNIIDTDLALLMQIGIDHCQWLGDTREKIGYEKAGILRPHSAWVCADPDPPASVTDYAASLQAPGWIQQRDFQSRVNRDDSWDLHLPEQDYKGLPQPAIPGAAQRQNAAAVVAAVTRLNSRLPVSQKAVMDGLRSVHLAGRQQRLSQDPRVLMDVAHNPDAAEVLAASLTNMGPHQRHAVVALLADKDAAGVLWPLLPHVAIWHVAGLTGSRGRSAQSLMAELSALAPESTCLGYDSITEAFAAAQALATADDEILVFGSFYTVTEVMSLANNKVV